MQWTSTRTRLLSMILGIALLSSAIAGPVAADHDSGDGLFGGASAEDDGLIDDLRAAASGFSERVLWAISGEETPAAENANETADTFNEHSDEWVDWVNERDLGSDDHEVLEMTFVDDEDNEATIYLIAEYNTTSGEYETAEFVHEDEFDDSRSIDERAELSGMAASSASDELDRFYSEFVKPNNDISSSYASEMGAKYGKSKHVTSTMIGDDLK